ncbi:hypothetical protein TURU_013181 [Turdus rufiventris]|nr:hypothetical protein TURU_013181 [Turdus rufiventris]
MDSAAVLLDGSAFLMPSPSLHCTLIPSHRDSPLPHLLSGQRWKREARLSKKDSIPMTTTAKAVRESPDLSVALSLDGQGDMSTTSLIFPEFISCMGNRIHLLLCQDKCFLSECLPDIPNCVSFPSQYGMSDLLYIDT